eukprot:1881432-Amphidinium_carterae.1
MCSSAPKGSDKENASNCHERVAAYLDFLSACRVPAKLPRKAVQDDITLTGTLQNSRVGCPSTPVS